MSLKKSVGLLAAFALAVGLIGAGVGAQFTDFITANENIDVGTFQCKIVDPSMGDLSPDGKTLTYTAPTIESSAAGSAPFTFTVKNTGSIAQVLTVATSPVSGPWSIINAPFVPVALAAGGTHLFDTGVAWTQLDNSNIGQSGTFTWTVNCNESGPIAIFDNTPPVLPSNLPSWGPEAYSFNEWGAGVTFAAGPRQLSSATVIMSSWACETGTWTDGSCVTTPGHTFSVPIRFNVYNVGAGNTVGTLIATQLQTFAIPFRPSADLVNCTGTDKGKWFDGSACKNGLANNIIFSFPSGTTLPNSAIFGITFNSDNFGYTHIGGSGAPTDSLNIATYPGTDLDGLTSVPALVGSWMPDNVHSYASIGSVPTTFIGSSPITSAGGFGPFGSLMPAVQITATY